MQTFHDFIEIENVLPKMKGIIELSDDIKEAYGPIARIIGIGPMALKDVGSEIPIKVGDYVVCNPGLGVSVMVNGRERFFMKAFGIMSKLTKLEAEIPLDLSKVKSRPSKNIVMIPDIEKQIIT